MECVTRVFYNDLPPDSHQFCVCVCVCASLHLWAFMHGVNFLRLNNALCILLLLH